MALEALTTFSPKDTITLVHTRPDHPKPWISINAPLGHENQGTIAAVGTALEWVFSFKYGTKNIGRAMGCDNSFFVPPEHFDEVLDLVEKVMQNMWGYTAKVVRREAKT